MSRQEGHIQGMDLLAYLDGELDSSKSAQVETHLETCALCTAELAELRFLRDGLTATIPQALSGVSMSPAAAERTRQRLARVRQREQGAWWAKWWQLLAWGRRLSRQWVLGAYAALALLVVFSALNALQSSRIAETADEQETLLLAQDQFAPGSQAAVRVLVRDVNNAAPVPDAEVSLRVARAPGLAQEVYRGQTDEFGAADIRFEVPPDVEGQAELVVETHSDKGQDTISQPIQITRRYRLLISSDKPIYQPGQDIHLRALALNSLDQKPAAGQAINLVVFSPSGDKLVQRSIPASDYGIAALDFPLDERAPEGDYTLQATLGDTVSEHVVSVKVYTLPRFQVTLETERTFYQPGSHVAGSLEADYFFGKPVSAAKVTLRGYIYDVGREQVIELYGHTDAAGRFEFGFDLPRPSLDSPTAQFGLEAQVTDAAGQLETSALALPLSTQSLLIEGVPESGRLKPGVENIVYLLTAYPDGRPAETQLTIKHSGQQSKLQTDSFGLAEYRFTPSGTIALRVSAQDAQGAEASEILNFPSDPGDLNLLLRAEQSTYQAGQTLRLEALIGGAHDLTGQVVYLDALKDGQTVLVTSAPVQANRAQFALDLDPSLFGALELCAYLLRPGTQTAGTGGQIVRDTRLLLVNAPHEIHINVRADRQTYRPGETASLAFDTQQSSRDPAIPPTPLQTALGIGIVDESVYAVQDQEPGFAQLYFLLQKELLAPDYQVYGVELPSLLEADDSARRQAQDTAVKAAWAEAPASKPSHLTHSIQSKLAALAERELDALHKLSAWLLRALLALPLALAITVIWGLRLNGAFSGALRRVSRGIGLLILTSPVMLPVFAASAWLTWTLLGALALVFALLAWLSAWAFLSGYAWRQSDQRAQIIAGLAAAYLFLGGVMTFVAANDGDLSSANRLAIALAYLLTLVSLAVFGQGLVIEGARRAGWAATALGLLLIPTTLFLGSLPGARSEFVRTLGSPSVYTLPTSLLTGCSSDKDAKRHTTVEKETVIAEKTVMEKETVVQEGEAVVKTVVETVIVETIIATDAPQPPRPSGSPMPTRPPLSQATPVSQATSAPTATVAPEPTKPDATKLSTEADAPQPTPSQPPRLRQFFPETLYWLAEAQTDENGHLALNVPLADSITTWRLTALASSRDGALGATTYNLRVFQDFFIDFAPPARLTQGDSVRLPVIVYNYLKQAQKFHLTLNADDPIEVLAVEYNNLPAQDANHATLTIAGNDVAVVYFTILAQEHGAARLTLRASGDELTDALARQIYIEPDGFETRDSLSDRLGDGVQASIEFPPSAITGTQRLEIKLYAGSAAQFLQGREALLARPSGDLAQVLAAHYANVLILEQASVESEQRHAERYVATGYQRLLTYELDGGGFSAFSGPNARPDLLLTARTRALLERSAHVYPVDQAVIERASQWLWAQQGDDGAWHTADPTLSVPLTALVAWALQDYAQDARMQFAINYLERHLAQTDDAYTLALIANALLAINPDSQAVQTALERLAIQAILEQGAARWASQGPALGGATGQALRQESSALATLALLQSNDEQHLEIAQQGLTALIRDRGDDGAWLTPQTTALALQAFNQALAHSETPADASVEIWLDGRPSHRIAITPDEVGVVRSIYLDDLEPGAHTLTLGAEGESSSLWYQIVAVYYQPWAFAPPPDQTPAQTLEVALNYDRTRLLLDETVMATLELRSVERPLPQQTIVELGLPPGFEIVSRDLNALVAQTANQATRLKRYEQVGSTLILYVENASDQTRRTAQFTFRLHARLAIEAQSGSVLAYDAHNPNTRAQQAPLQISVAAP